MIYIDSNNMNIDKLSENMRALYFKYNERLINLGVELKNRELELAMRKEAAKKLAQSPPLS